MSEEVLELPNGCLCCSIKDLGVAAIEKLMQRKGAFDHILLETTGLADPGAPLPDLIERHELATLTVTIAEPPSSPIHDQGRPTLWQDQLR